MTDSKLKDKNAYKSLLRRVIAEYDYKWPKQLTSGVMFYNGETIRIEDFKKEARLFNEK